MTTTTQANTELIRRFIREANDKNYDQVVQLFTADYTRHDPDTPGNERGPEPFVEALQQLHEAFPENEIHIGEMVAENDLVAFEGTMTGTHEGVFRGIEPTHESIDIPGNAMHRVRDGRIAETWATWDFLGALEQLGVSELPRE